jgi:AcrR family transcriptional regulator
VIRREPKRPKRSTPRRPARRDSPDERRARVLDAALELMSERGIAGASLRTLAKRLGMSQPSLYHYFPTKSALIPQIVEYGAQQMMSGLSVPPPRRIGDLPKYVVDAVLELYERETHPRFVRFLFVVAIEAKEHQAFVRRVFEERLDPSFGVLADAFAKTPAERAELGEILRMVVYSLGFMLLDDRALMARPEPRASTRRYAEWIVGTAKRLIAERCPASSA